MDKRDYESHIDEPVTYVTSKGGVYVKPFDVVRSTRGRDIVDRHAQMARTPTPEKVAGTKATPQKK